VLHVRDAGHGCDERRGELRDVVHHHVRRPLLDDVDQVVRARLQLTSHEELGKQEVADLRSRKRGGPVSNPSGKRLHRIHVQSTPKRREAFHCRFARDRFTRRKATSCPASAKARASGSIGRK
jgi:hypothetical protein